MVVYLNNVSPPEGFYAINNQFLRIGQKGFAEYKILENTDIFIRGDFPGVSEETIRIEVNQNNKAIDILAYAPKEHKHDLYQRNYATTVGLFCECCRIFGFTSSMSNGVLRLQITKANINPEISPCSTTLGCTNPYDPMYSGQVLMRHPFAIGSGLAYESKTLKNGGLFVRVDMPGVPDDKFTVSVNNGKVNVTGEAPAVSHDASARFYSGDVAMLTSALRIPLRKIKTTVKNGVIRLVIPPV